MPETLDLLGPVDWIVAEFPGSKCNGEIAPEIKAAVDRGTIRLLDLLVLKKEDDGAYEAFEMSDLDPSELGELRAYEAELATVLSAQDVADIAETIEVGSSAAILVWENTWAAPIATAIRHAGGLLVASGRIPIQAIIAAAEEDAAAVQSESREGA
jgi:hypothetical protein